MRYLYAKKRMSIISPSATLKDAPLKTIETVKKSTRKKRIKLSPRLLLSFFIFMLFLVFSIFFDFGFDAYLCDRYIGVVSGYEETNKIIKNLLSDNKKLFEIAPELYLRIISRNDFSDKNILETNILLALGITKTATQCKIGNDILFYMEDEQKLQNAINQYISKYNEYGEASLGVSIDKSSVIVYTDKIIEENKAAEILAAHNVPVNTVEYILKETNIPCEVLQTEDDNLYKGDTKVTKEGKNGIAEQEIKISRVNGVITSEEVISETTILPAMAELQSVGTKELPTGIGTGVFCYPVSAEITSPYGDRWGRQHKGIDFGAQTGTPIIASDGGTVVFSGVQTGFGNIIILDHKNGYKTYYAHCSKLYAKENDKVESGDVIASVGNTGNSTGEHLHFEIRFKDTPVNPLNYLK